MKNITINNEKQLQKFLKLVAEESVKKSLREVDANLQNYTSQKSKDEKVYTSLKEEEEAEEDIEVETETDDDNNDDNKISLKDKVIESEITPRKIMARINNIRAGHSLKNTEVKENLISFLERLDDNELLVLFYYLDDIAKILNQTISGEEAIDPSEDPLNIDMTRTGSPDLEKTQISKKSKPVKSKSDDGEDTSPPIKVNESQDKIDIRRKIRILMS